MSDDACEKMQFRLSNRCVATFTLESDRVTATFEPGLPARFTPSEAEAYRRGRAAMLQRLEAQRVRP
jgi:hypothetical protein